MKAKEHILGLVIILDFVLVSLSDNLKGEECQVLLERFSESSSRFLRCATQFSRPIKMCRECKEDFLDVKKYYVALEHAEEEGIVCKDLLTSRDKVEIIKETYDFIIGTEGLWAKGYCSSCYTQPFGEESQLTNSTKNFFIRYQTVIECFNMYPNGSGGVERSDACTECRDDYDDLQEYYKDYFLAQKFPDLTYCYDVVDAMNSTQQRWGSGHFHCGRQLQSSAPLISAVLVVLSSPVLLYLLVKFSPGTTPARERLVAQTNITGYLTAASHSAREAARTSVEGERGAEGEGPSSQNI